MNKKQITCLSIALSAALSMSVLCGCGSKASAANGVAQNFSFELTTNKSSAQLPSILSNFDLDTELAAQSSNVVIQCGAGGLIDEQTGTVGTGKRSDIFQSSYIIYYQPSGYPDGTVIIDGQMEWLELPKYRGEDILKSVCTNTQFCKPLDNFHEEGMLIAEYADGEVVEKKIVKEPYEWQPLDGEQFRFDLGSLPKGAKKIRVRARVAMQAAQDFSLSTVYTHRKVGFGAKYRYNETARRVNTFYDVVWSPSVHIKMTEKGGVL